MLKISNKIFYSDMKVGILKIYNILVNTDDINILYKTII